MKPRARNIYKARYGKLAEDDPRHIKAAAPTGSLLESKIADVARKLGASTEELAKAFKNLGHAFEEMAATERVRGRFQHLFGDALTHVALYAGIMRSERMSARYTNARPLPTPEGAADGDQLFRFEPQPHFRSVDLAAIEQRIAIQQLVRRAHYEHRGLLSMLDSAALARIGANDQPAPARPYVAPTNPDNPRDLQSAPTYRNPNANIRGFRRG